MNNDYEPCDINHNTTEKVTMTDVKIPKRKTENVERSVAEWCTRLIDMELEFVTPIPELVEQLCKCTCCSLSHFKTCFRRTTPGHEYTHLTPVRISSVLSGCTQIWTDEDKLQRQRDKYLTKIISKWCTKLTEMELMFVTPIPALIEQLRNCGCSYGDFKTLFKRTTPGHEYTNPTPVKIGLVLRGQMQILSSEDRKKQQREKYIAKIVNEWRVKLASMELAFALPIPDLVEQLRNCDVALLHFKTLFKRTTPGHEYTHPIPIAIDNVLRGHVKIWNDDDKKAHFAAVNAKHHPRGVDTSGNTETERAYDFFQPFMKIIEMFEFKETVRGSLTDMIAIYNTDHESALGLQIATAQLSKNGRFSLHKTIRKIITYLNNKLIVLFIYMADDRIVGVYMLPPTPDVIHELSKFEGSLTFFQSAMLNKKNTSSTFCKYMENFRYIHDDFKKDVEGVFKDLSEFQTDFLELGDKYPYIVNTPFYFASLFADTAVGQRAEWAGNVSFELNVANVLDIQQKYLHGNRGDVRMRFDDDCEIDDERKILGVHSQVDSSCCKLELRNRGRQGLDPSKNVRATTAIVRLDRSNKYPGDPKDFTAIIPLPVLTASGNIALRPDDPSARTLYMNCDIANHNEWIEVTADMIGADAYPPSMQKIDRSTCNNKTTKKTLIRAVFYYDDLKPGSQRLAELRELYRMFAEREPNEAAIAAYKLAVTDELIDREKTTIVDSKKSKSVENVAKDVVNGLVDQVEAILNQIE